MSMLGTKCDSLESDFSQRFIFPYYYENEAYDEKKYKPDGKSNTMSKGQYLIQDWNLKA